VHRARAALPDAAAELRARQAEVIADDPQQRRLRVGIDGFSLSVYVKIERHLASFDLPNYRSSFTLPPDLRRIAARRQSRLQRHSVGFNFVNPGISRISLS
jgi:hypothetical protein